MSWDHNKKMRAFLLFMLLLFLTMPLLLVIRGEWEIALYWYAMLGMAWVGEWLAIWLNKNMQSIKTAWNDWIKNNV